MNIWWRYELKYGVSLFDSCRIYTLHQTLNSATPQSSVEINSHRNSSHSHFHEGCFALPFKFSRVIYCFSHSHGIPMRFPFRIPIGQLFPWSSLVWAYTVVRLITHDCTCGVSAHYAIPDRMVEISDVVRLWSQGEHRESARRKSPSGPVQGWRPGWVAGGPGAETRLGLGEARYYIQMFST